MSSLHRDAPKGTRNRAGPGLVCSAHVSKFVIQHHQARALHYDLRLEIDGTGKSWAVPKGPSLNPADKRLAVAVGDHELDYFGFEGLHDRGGGVIIWDEGTVEFPDDALTGLESGSFDFVLHGHKVRGRFTLRKTAKTRRGDDWILFKRTDAFVDRGEPVTKARPESVRSGLTIEELLARQRP